MSGAEETQMGERMKSAELAPGTKLRWTGPNPVINRVVTLERRKSALHDPNPDNLRFFPGWWLVEGGGIADFVIDDEHSQWVLE